MHDTHHQLSQIHSAIESLEGGMKVATELFDKLSHTDVSHEIQKELQSNNRRIADSLTEAKSKLKQAALYEKLKVAAQKHGAINASTVAKYIIYSNAYYDGANINQLIERLKHSPETSFLFNGSASTTTTVQTLENPWLKESLNLTKQGIILKSNPELAARFMSEAMK